jgi:hypothetical protein
MHRMRRQNLHHVQIVLQEPCVIAVDGGLRELAPAAAQAVCVAVAQRDDGCLRVVAIAAEMQIGDAAETHDTDLDHGAASSAWVRYANCRPHSEEGSKAMPKAYVHAIKGPLGIAM